MSQSGRGMILKGVEKLMARIVSLRLELDEVGAERDALREASREYMKADADLRRVSYEKPDVLHRAEGDRFYRARERLDALVSVKEEA